MNPMAWDTWLFYWINRGHQNGFFDLVMPIITEFEHWRYPLLMLWIILFFGGDRSLKVTFFLLALLIGILDYSNSFGFKHLFDRPRPCNVLPGVHTFGGCPASFSFPSNHAANMFGAAFFLGYAYRRWRWVLMTSALLVGYSRVYVGEHYPLDVVGGLVLGGLGAVLFLRIRKTWLTRIRQRRESRFDNQKEAEGWIFR